MGLPPPPRRKRRFVPTYEDSEGELSSLRAEIALDVLAALLAEVVGRELVEVSTAGLLRMVAERLEESVQ